MSERANDAELRMARRLVAKGQRGGMSMSNIDSVIDMVPKLVEEIEQRRAADLSDEEREALGWLVEKFWTLIGPDVMNDPWNRQKRAAFAILSRLIGARP